MADISEDIVTNITESIVADLGIPITTSAVAAQLLIKVTNVFARPKSVETAVTKQLPSALEVALHTRRAVVTHCTEKLSHLLPVESTRQRLHQAGISREEKLSLWDSVFLCATSRVLILPYFHAMVCTMLSVRASVALLVQLQNQEKEASWWQTLKGGKAGMMNAMMTSLLGQVGGGSFMDSIRDESDAKIIQLCDEVVLPLMVRIGFEAVQEAFGQKDTWDLTKAVRVSDFESAFAAAKQTFEKNVEWEQLAEGFARISQDGSLAGAEDIMSGLLSGMMGGSPSASPANRNPTEQQVVDRSSKMRKTFVEYCEAIGASASFKALVLHQADGLRDETVRAIVGSGFSSCKSYDTEAKSAVLLQVVLGIAKEANVALVVELTQLPLLTRQFCTEMIRNSSL